MDGNVLYINEKSNFLFIIRKVKNSKLYFFSKRLIDIIVSLLALIILFPFLLIVSFIIFLEDKTSPFYSQMRIGKNGKEFKLYKFRSMIPNADEVLNNYLKNNKKMREEYEVNKKLCNDPRITKVGCFIRRYSIDELPQLINILKGDMTLIGNRPYLPKEKEDMSFYYNTIISTKPGLTGYWQVSGRSDLSFQKRLQLEHYYSNNRCFKLDLNIFLKTFGAVLGHRGAK